jgi:aspartyl-tRNA(Asn)/glutamyl-tRNA(Gln) amidotransferase subunit C
MTIDETKKLARLARLQITDTEAGEYTKELSVVFDSFAALDQIDISGLEPTYQVTGLVNVFRGDVIEAQVEQQSLLSNAPDRQGDYLKVGKML